MNCLNCHQPLPDKNIYCNNCGELAIRDPKVKTINWDGWLMIGYFILMAFCVGLGTRADRNYQFEATMVVYALMALFTIMMCGARRQWLAGIFNPSRIEWSIVLIVAMVSVLFGIAVWGYASRLNPDLERYIDNSYFAPFEKLNHPCFFTVLFVSVYPAIFEELGFRGFLLGGLSRYLSARQTIVLSGIIFAFAHYHFISFFYLLPMGIFYSYLRYRYKTIYYGVLAHFIHNTVVIYMDYLSLF
jgi:membrane protease YdiL (CAAX protease family)